MSDFINTAEVLGDEVVVDRLIDRTITEYKENRVKRIGSYALYACRALTTVNLPNAKSIDSYVFSKCSALTTADFSNALSISYGAFSDCSRLTTLILRSATVCTLQANAASGTPIASGTGYIYVPDDLVDTYKSATNWSAYANQIKPISELGE